MRRTPRTPVNKLSRAEQTERFPTAESYLKGHRADVADEIIQYATIAADMLRQPGALEPPLNAHQRRRGLKAARIIVPLVARSHPGTVLTLSLLINQWSNATVRRGRRRGAHALFVNAMLMVCAGELGARGLPQLTATELIAAAAAGALPGVSWADRGRLLDSWRKLRRENLPKYPEKLVSETRERLKLQEDKRRPGEFNERKQLAAAAALRSRNRPAPTP